MLSKIDNGYRHAASVLQALEERHKKLQEAKAYSAGSSAAQAASVSELSTQLAHKATDIHRLQEDLLQKRHQLASQDITVQELHAAVQGAKNATQLAQDHGHRYACKTWVSCSDF